MSQLYPLGRETTNQTGAYCMHLHDAAFPNYRDDNIIMISQLQQYKKSYMSRQAISYHMTTQLFGVVIEIAWIFPGQKQPNHACHNSSQMRISSSMWLSCSSFQTDIVRTHLGVATRHLFSRKGCCCWRGKERKRKKKIATEEGERGDPKDQPKLDTDSPGRPDSGAATGNETTEPWLTSRSRGSNGSSKKFSKAKRFAS